MTRFPTRVYGQGEEPDPRFSLANERTFLAWIRTSLALFAAAVALEALELPASPTFRLAAALVFVALGVLASLQAWLGWMSAERALRRGAPLPGFRVGLVVSAGVIAGAALVGIGFFV